jgi:hypothetical protein
MLHRPRVAGRRNLKRLAEARSDEQRALVDADSRRVLERGWVAEPGFTMPNRRKYPWQWLWDSCFHAIAWSALGDARCVLELDSLFALQLPNGFLPHMGYQREPQHALELWQGPGRSDITQPPMYGHALRVLAAREMRIEHLYEPARAGLRYLLERRRDPGSGLIRVLHPWETGCDDSPRWDGWDERPFREKRWIKHKRELVRSLVLEEDAATANPNFDVASAGFSALVSFNAQELAALTGDSSLEHDAAELRAAIERQWVAEGPTWADVRLRGTGSGAAAPTLDGLFPLLVSQDEAHVESGFADLFDAGRFWRPFGPSSLAADQPQYEPGRYWRGDAWPQQTYLLMIAARRHGRAEDEQRLARALVTGCANSCFAERWNADTGRAVGAMPQGWAALASEGVRVLAGGG